jgi:CHAD domain-containing protein
LLKYCERVSIDFDEDNIHELRINFKKLRAVLRLQKATKILTTDIKSIYEIAGELRNIQVANKLLSEEENLHPAIMPQLLENLSVLKMEWKNVYDKKILIRLFSNFRNLKIKPKRCKPFLSKKFKKLQHLLNAKYISDHEFHEARKLAKDIQYVMEVCKNSHCSKSGHKISLKTSKKIGKEIGSYNDLRMLIVLLSKFKPFESDPAGLVNIYPFIAKKLLEKKEKKQAMLTRVHQLMMD